MNYKTLFIAIILLMFRSTLLASSLFQVADNKEQSFIIDPNSDQSTITIDISYSYLEQNGTHNRESDSTYLFLYGLTPSNSNLFISNLFIQNIDSSRCKLTLVYSDNIKTIEIENPLYNLTSGDTLKLRSEYDKFSSELRVSLSTKNMTSATTFNNIEYGANVNQFLRTKDSSPLIYLSSNINTGKTNTNSNRDLFWIIIIVIIDLIVLVFVLQKRRSKVKSEHVKEHEIDTVNSKKITATDLKHISYIQTFGSFAVFNKQGVDISRKFTPIMREILIILLYYSYTGGIKWERLKEIIWFDKDEVNARNNRAVYFNKIKKLLSDVGELNLHNTDNRWLLELNHIEVDLLIVFEIINKRSITKFEAYKALKIIKAGVFTQYLKHPHFERIKEKLNDDIIMFLSYYLNKQTLIDDTNFVIDICDTIFILDSLYETALIYKCKALKRLNKLPLAKIVYSTYANEYYHLYDEKYSQTLQDLLVIKDDEDFTS